MRGGNPERPDGIGLLPGEEEEEQMPKIVGTRERVHQPFYDSLIRVDGAVDLRTTNVGPFGAVPPRAQLFNRQGADLSVTNLKTGGFFPSDQTFVTLAVRVWTYFRFNPESVVSGAPIGADPAVVSDRIMRVHKLYHQAENQIFWQFIAGDKPQLTTFTAYTPAAGGLDGFFADTRLPRANNGTPSSAALMRLARPILVPPRQGFQVVASLTAIGQAAGSSIIEQLNGLVANPQTGLSEAGPDNIAKDIKYLIDGIHSRDVL